MKASVISKCALCSVLVASLPVTADAGLSLEAKMGVPVGSGGFVLTQDGKAACRDRERDTFEAVAKLSLGSSLQIGAMAQLTPRRVLSIEGKGGDGAGAGMGSTITQPIGDTLSLNGVISYTFLRSKRKEVRLHVNLFGGLLTQVTSDALAESIMREQRLPLRRIGYSAGTGVGATYMLSDGFGFVTEVNVVADLLELGAQDQQEDGLFGLVRYYLSVGVVLG